MGRQQWESVVANATRQSLVATLQTLTVPSIAINQVLQYQFYAPPGCIGKVQTVYLACDIAPSAQAATTGYTDAALGLAGIPSGICYGRTPFNSTLKFGKLAFLNGATNLEPNDIAAVATGVRDATFDSVYGLGFNFGNYTDKVLTNLTLTWNIGWLKIQSA